MAEGVPKALPFSQILFPPFLVSASSPGLGLLLDLDFWGFFLLRGLLAQLCPAKAPQGAATFLSLPWEWEWEWELGTPGVPEVGVWVGIYE